MTYSLSPIQFELDDNKDLKISRPLNNTIMMIDNWVDTVIFTSIRRFKGDEDFGFSFWDNELIAMNLRDFNNGSDYKIVKDKRNGRDRKEQMSLAGIRQCECSIRDSIAIYIPSLKDIQVDVQLSMEKSEFSQRGRGSKYVVRILIKGKLTLSEYAGTSDENYQRRVEFFMDPFFNSKQ